MQIQLTSSEQESRLSLSGEFGLLEAGRIKAELTQALASARRVIIDIQALSHIDISCLQLLHAAHQSALSAGKELVLSSRQPEVFMRQIVRSGLINQDGSDQKDCFWNGEDR